MQTDFMLDELEQALYERQHTAHALTHHSDRGSQYVSIRYSERQSQAGIQHSVGSRGKSYHNALAETINGLDKAELIHRQGPWKTRESVELATLKWVQWFNHVRRLASVRGASLRQKLRQLLQATRCRQHLNRGVNLIQFASTIPGAVHSVSAVWGSKHAQKERHRADTMVSPFAG